MITSQLKLISKFTLKMIVNKLMKKYQTSFVIKGLKTETRAVTTNPWGCSKSKTLSMPNMMEMQSHRDCHHGQYGCKGCSPLENCVAVSYKAKHSASIETVVALLGNYSENFCSYKILHACTYSRFIYSCSKLNRPSCLFRGE